RARHRQRDQLHHLRRNRRPSPEHGAADAPGAVERARARVDRGHRGPRDRGDHLHSGWPAPRSGAVRKARARHSDVLRREHLHSASRNSAGVIPIIFAISILLLPNQVAQYFTTSDTEWLRNVSTAIVAFFQNPIFYNLTYFVLVVAFTFFY